MIPLRTFVGEDSTFASLSSAICKNISEGSRNFLPFDKVLEVLPPFFTIHTSSLPSPFYRPFLLSSFFFLRVFLTIIRPWECAMHSKIILIIQSIK